MLEVLQVGSLSRENAGCYRRRCTVAKLLLREVLLAHILTSLGRAEGSSSRVEDNPQNHVHAVENQVAQSKDMHQPIGPVVVEVLVGFHHIEQQEVISCRATHAKA